MTEVDGCRRSSRLVNKDPPTFFLDSWVGDSEDDSPSTSKDGFAAPKKIRSTKWQTEKRLNPKVPKRVTASNAALEGAEKWVVSDSMIVEAFKNNKKTIELAFKFQQQLNRLSETLHMQHTFAVSLINVLSYVSVGNPTLITLQHVFNRDLKQIPHITEGLIKDAVMDEPPKKKLGFNLIGTGLSDVKFRDKFIELFRSVFKSFEPNYGFSQQLVECLSLLTRVSFRIFRYAATLCVTIAYGCVARNLSNAVNHFQLFEKQKGDANDDVDQMAVPLLHTIQASQKVLQAFYQSVISVRLRDVFEMIRSIVLLELKELLHDVPEQIPMTKIADSLFLLCQDKVSCVRETALDCINVYFQKVPPKSENFSPQDAAAYQSAEAIFKQHESAISGLLNSATSINGTKNAVSLLNTCSWKLQFIRENNAVISILESILYNNSQLRFNCFETEYLGLMREVGLFICGNFFDKVPLRPQDETHLQMLLLERVEVESHDLLTVLMLIEEFLPTVSFEKSNHITRSDENAFHKIFMNVLISEAEDGSSAYSIISDDQIASSRQSRYELTHLILQALWDNASCVRNVRLMVDLLSVTSPSKILVSKNNGFIVDPVQGHLRFSLICLMDCAFNRLALQYPIDPGQNNLSNNQTLILGGLEMMLNRLPLLLKQTNHESNELSGLLSACINAFSGGGSHILTFLNSNYESTLILIFESLLRLVENIVFPVPLYLSNKLIGTLMNIKGSFTETIISSWEAQYNIYFASVCDDFLQASENESDVKYNSCLYRLHALLTNEPSFHRLEDEGSEFKGLLLHRDYYDRTRKIFSFLNNILDKRIDQRNDKGGSNSITNYIVAIDLLVDFYQSLIAEWSFYISHEHFSLSLSRSSAFGFLVELIKLFRENVHKKLIKIMDGDTNTVLQYRCYMGLVSIIELECIVTLNTSKQRESEVEKNVIVSDTEKMDSTARHLTFFLRRLVNIINDFFPKTSIGTMNSFFANIQNAAFTTYYFCAAREGMERSIPSPVFSNISISDPVIDISRHLLTDTVLKNDLKGQIQHVYMLYKSLDLLQKINVFGENMLPRWFGVGCLVISLLSSSELTPIFGLCKKFVLELKQKDSKVLFSLVKSTCKKFYNLDASDSFIDHKIESLVHVVSTILGVKINDHIKKEMLFFIQNCIEEVIIDKHDGKERRKTLLDYIKPLVTRRGLYTRDEIETIIMNVRIRAKEESIDLKRSSIGTFLKSLLSDSKVFTPDNNPVNNDLLKPTSNAENFESSDPKPLQEKHIEKQNEKQQEEYQQKGNISHEGNEEQMAPEKQKKNNSRDLTSTAISEEDDVELVGRKLTTGNETNRRPSEMTKTFFNKKSDVQIIQDEVALPVQLVANNANTDKKRKKKKNNVPTVGSRSKRSRI